MKYRIGVARLCVNGNHRAEVGNTLVEIVSASLLDPAIKDQIEDVDHFPVAQVPAPVARNKAVKYARKAKCDILYMIDDDMGPAEGFFKVAFQHLIEHGPGVVGTPYVCGGDQQEVQVFNWASPGNHAQQSFTLSHIPREDATRRVGIEPCPNIGTGYIAYDMRVFDTFEKVYGNKVFFEYSYNEDHTKVTETEECYFHRHLYFAGVNLWVAWTDPNTGDSLWSDHYKIQRHRAPYLVNQGDIQETYLKQAYAYLHNDPGYREQVWREVQAERKKERVRNRKAKRLKLT